MLKGIQAIDDFLTNVGMVLVAFLHLQRAHNFQRKRFSNKKQFF